MASTQKTAIVTGALGNRGSTRRSVFEARLQRSCKLAKHHQSQDWAASANLALVDGDMATENRRQRSWIPPYPADRTC